MKDFMRKSFFSRHSFMVILLAALIVYFLFAVVSIGIRKLSYDKQKAAVRAAQQQFNALSSAEKAIHKAEAYQVKMITAAHPFHRLLFDYLQRTYSLRKELSVESSPFQIPTQQTQQSVELQYLARIAFPDKVLTQPPTVSVEDISLTNVYAANCDNFALPNNYWEVMRNQYKQGGYYLTHVALAYRLLKDNKCNIPDDAKVLESQVNRGMIAIAADPSTGADLRYEVIAFLLLAGNRSDVRQGWVDQIAKEQLFDGGWAAEVGGTTANDHSTLLAMWALLQYSRPDIEYQPLIRHPSS